MLKNSKHQKSAFLENKAEAVAMHVDCYIISKHRNLFFFFWAASIRKIFQPGRSYLLEINQNMVISACVPIICISEKGPRSIIVQALDFMSYLCFCDDSNVDISCSA